MRPSGLRRWVSAFVLTVILAALCLAPGIAGAEVRGAAAPAPTLLKELPELQTENSKTYLLSSGARRVDLYAAPIQFKDESGNWKEIDTSLIVAPDGSLTSAATPLKVQLSPKDDGGLVVLLDRQGASVELCLTGYAFAAPELAKDTASYRMLGPVTETPTEVTTATAAASPTVETPVDPATEETSSETAPDALELPTTTTEPVKETTTTQLAPSPDVSLSYQILPSGLKETIILGSAESPSAYTFTLSHPGLILHQDAKGTWGLYRMLEEGPVMILGGLNVADSSRDAAGDPVYCREATMTVKPGKDESTVTYALPQAWLSQPARVFPVLLDPTVYTATGTTLTADTYTSDATPGTAYGSATKIQVGDQGSGKRRGYVSFSLPEDLTGAYVQGATLQLRQSTAKTDAPSIVQVARMTKEWDEASTYTAIGAPSAYDLLYAKQANAPTSEGAVSFDYRDVTQQWADGAPNFGVCLYTTSTGTDDYREFYSSEYATTAYRPKLTVTYLPAIDVTASPYNADDTGTADATTAIQSAITQAEAYGAVVYLPAGLYKVSGLTIGRSHLIIKGAGSSTQLIVTSATQDHVFLLDGAGAVTDVTLKDFYLRLPAQGYGVKLTGAQGGSDITLKDLTFGGGADSSVTRAILATDDFTDLTILENDLTAMTALPLGIDAAASATTVFGNDLFYQPYRSDLVAGGNGVDTAVRLSEGAFPSGVTAAGGAVVIAPGGSSAYQAALCAAPLAKAYGGPLLLNTSTTGLDAGVRAEVQRLNPDKVFLVGFDDTMKAAVVKDMPASEIIKLSGSDLFSTATAVADQIKSKNTTVGRVVVVPSDDYDDAMTVAAIAAANGWPVLFTPKVGTLNSTTAAWYTANMSTPKALEVGTTVTLTGIQAGNVEQRGGSDAFATALSVADYAATTDGGACTYAHVGLAGTDDWENAVLVGAALGKDSGMLLLTDVGTLSAAVEARLKANYVALDYLTYVGLPTLFAADQNPLAFVASAPAHVSHDLGSFAGHAATAILDTGQLELSTTDLAIASFGPAATLDRTYSSARASAGYFTAGWRFGFEVSLDLSQKDAQGRIDYIDESGEVFTFLRYGTQWLSPPGNTGALWAADASTWKLNPAGGNTLTFDAEGKLQKEEDGNGNAVTYSWTDGYLTAITAANGHAISLDLDESHKLTAATYQTTDGTRTVGFDAANATVTYFPGESGLEHALTYGYDAERLITLTANDFVGASESALTFLYSGTPSRLAAVRYPDYEAGVNTDPRTEITYDGPSAVIHTWGRIYSTSSITGTAGTEVTQTYTWNPSGTLAAKTNPKTGGTDETWTYTYAPVTNYLLAETSPLAKVRTFTYNNRGNVTSETDWHDPQVAGDVTRYSYPDHDPDVGGTVQTRVAADLDDGYNASTTLHVTDYLYLAIGRGTAIDKGGFRFRNIGIPEGATITSAQLSLYAFYTATGNPANLQTKLGAEAADSPGIWVAGSHEPRLATVATGWVNWAPAEWKAGKWYTSPNFKDSVQAVIDRAGWHKGNALAVLWVDNGTAASNICNPADQGYAPGWLTITWTKDYDPDASQDQPKSVTDPRGHLTEQTVDAKGNLLSVRRQLNETQWSETRYTYADKTVGSATYKGALTEEKSLISGPPESGVWAVTDYDTGAYYPNGRPEKTVTRDVVLSEGQPDVDLTATQTYDLFGNLKTQTDTAGKETVDNDYDVAGRLTLSRGPQFQATLGATATTTRVEKHLLYDPWGHVTQSWNESTSESPHTQAGWVATTYDIAGRPSEVRSKLSSGTVSSTQTLSYDGLGRLIQTADSTVSGLPALAAYDARGGVVAAWAAGACSGSYDLAKATRNVNGDVYPNNTPAYDALGRVQKTALPGTDPTTFTYTADNRLLRETKPDGTWTEFAYDANGNVTQTMTSKSSPSQLTTAVFDYGDRRTSFTDGNNLTTTYAYDLLGRQVSAGTGAGASLFTYNTLGWQLKVQDADGFTTSRAYDRAGRLSAEESAGYTTAYLYQDVGAGEAGLLAGTRELGAPTRWEQTDTTHITKTGTWSDYAKTEASAGSYGRSASTGASATITFTGTRLDYIAMTGTTPGVVEVKLDGVTKATIDLYSATPEYQVRAWSSGTLESGSHTVQLIRSTQSLTGEYHVLDAVDVWGPPAREAAYTYDWFGRTTSDLQETAGVPLKNTVTEYDSLGRVTDSSDAVRHLDHTFSYPADTPGGVTDAQAVGSGSDLVSTTLAIGADGLEASRASDITSSPDIPDVTRSITTRDSAKRVTKATTETGPSRYLYAQYAFDSSGRLQKQWGPDSGEGSGYLSTAATTNAYAYDSLSGLLASEDLQLASVGSAGVITGSYTYTANGRLSTATTNGVTETYSFSPSGNLTSYGGGTSLTYTENRLATLTAGGQTTYFFFDAAKRWRTGQAPTNSQSDANRTEFSYTGTGRLSGYQKYGTGALTATYTYDTQGQRTRSVVAVTGGLTTTTDYSYAGLLLQSLSATQAGTGAESWKITYLYDEYGKPYAGVYRSPGSSTTPVVFGMVTTDRGDVVELLDVHGQPFAAYRYDAWGNPQGTGNLGTGIWSQATTYGGQTIISATLASEIAKRQVLRYASYCWDALDPSDSTVGLYYLSARHYDPKTRQFLAKDISRNDGEQSAYQYCLGNPVRYVDPTGYKVDFYGGAARLSERATRILQLWRVHYFAERLRKSPTRLDPGVYDTTRMSANDLYSLYKGASVRSWWRSGPEEYIYQGVMHGMKSAAANKPLWFNRDPANCIVVRGGKVFEPLDNTSEYYSLIHGGAEYVRKGTVVLSRHDKDGKVTAWSQYPSLEVIERAQARNGFVQFVSDTANLGIALGLEKLKYNDSAAGDVLGGAVDSWLQSAKTQVPTATIRWKYSMPDL